MHYRFLIDVDADPESVDSESTLRAQALADDGVPVFSFSSGAGHKRYKAMPYTVTLDMKRRSLEVHLTGGPGGGAAAVIAESGGDGGEASDEGSDARFRTDRDRRDGAGSVVSIPIEGCTLHCEGLFPLASMEQATEGKHPRTAEPPAGPPDSQQEPEEVAAAGRRDAAEARGSAGLADGGKAKASDRTEEAGTEKTMEGGLSGIPDFPLSEMTCLVSITAGGAKSPVRAELLFSGLAAAQEFIRKVEPLVAPWLASTGQIQQGSDKAVVDKVVVSNVDDNKEGGGGSGAAHAAEAEPKGGGATSPSATPVCVTSASAVHPARSASARWSPSHPVHHPCPYSLLSSQRQWHTKHSGLINLAMIILALTNFRLALENALKYGWRLNPVKLVRDIGRSNPLLLVCPPAAYLAALVSLGIERFAYRLMRGEDPLREAVAAAEAELAAAAAEEEARSVSKEGGAEEKVPVEVVDKSKPGRLPGALARDSPVGRSVAVLRARVKVTKSRYEAARTTHEVVVFVLALLNSSTVIGLPWFIIAYTNADPALGGLQFLFSVCCWLKVVSLHHCSADLRQARREGRLCPGERGGPEHVRHGHHPAAAAAAGQPGGGEVESTQEVDAAGKAADQASSLSHHHRNHHHHHQASTPPPYGSVPAATGKPAAATPVAALVRPLVSAAPAEAPLAAGGAPSSDIPSGSGSVAEEDEEILLVKTDLLQYPENLTVGNLSYFLVAPTLCYQVNYPRSSRVRRRWLLRRLAELVIVATVATIVVHQYIEPTVHNAMEPLKSMDLPRLCERVLKLAVPNLYVWLAVFYLTFHLWLNILAELTRFGDREFYKEWWNASTVGEYWRLWNMPVHRWLVRHVYFPALRRGLSREGALVAVFFVSAVFHELVLGVPLNMVRWWAFCGIMFQVPLIMVSERLKRMLNSDVLGNCIFWISFCVVGQPVCVLLYYHDYLVSRDAAAAAVTI